MSHYRRANIDGGNYFFTVVAYRRQPILCDVAIRAALRDAILSVRRAKPFSVDAWVLLPDHLHCMWTLPPGGRGAIPPRRVDERLEAETPRSDDLATPFLGALHPRRRRFAAAC